MALSRTSPSVGPQSPDVTGFYDKPTGSIQYLVSDPQTRKAAIIDAVMGFDPASAATDSSGVEHILRYAETERLEIEWILDTHHHADHLMASHWLKQRLGKPNAVGAKVKEIAALWRGSGLFSEETDSLVVSGCSACFVSVSLLGTRTSIT